MKYVVNGVEYTNLKEAEAAEKKLEADKKAKNDLAVKRQEDASAVQDAANSYLNLVAENNKKRNELKKSETDAYKEYKKLLDKFADDHNGYRLVYTNDRNNVNFKIEEAKQDTIEAELAETRSSILEFLKNFWNF